MDELLGTFIRAHYSPELTEEIYRTFGLMSLFGDEDGLDIFDNVLDQQNDGDGSAVIDLFMTQLLQRQDFLLGQHALTIREDATLTQKNDILQGLYMLPYLYDYTSISLSLEAMITPEEKVLRVLQDITNLGEHELYPLLSGWRPVFLERVKAQIREHEEEGRDTSSLGEVRANLQRYRHLFGQPAFTQMLIEAHLLPARPFVSYIPFVQEHLYLPDNPKETALRIYWLLLMSSDGTQQPLIVLREHQSLIYPTLEAAQPAERHLVALIGRLEELRTVQNEKA